MVRGAGEGSGLRRRVVRALAIAVVALATGAVTVFLWALLGALPAEPSARLPASPAVFLDRNGLVLYALPANGQELRLWTPLGQIAPAARRATLATEDGRFYQRPIGLDPLAMARAAWNGLFSGGSAGGGSTIEEQLARTLYLAPAQRGERSLGRKAQEWVWALRLGHRFSHDRLLELYLNAVDYGNGAAGIEAAAQIYFGKPARDLDLAESALLAGLPQSPTRYDPLRYPQAALARRNQVLALMRSHGQISRTEQRAAAAEPLGLAPRQHPLEAPHFVALVRAQLEQRLGSGRVAAGNLVVQTTLDLGLQRTAEETVTRRLADLNEHDVNDAALVALDPRTGELLALVGGADYFDPARGGAFDAALAPRQPGSAIKPVIYAAALGSGLTAASELDDVHQSFAGDDAAYAPSDYDNTFHGPVTLRVALASSLNVPAVEAFARTGREPVLRTASALGLDSLAQSAAGLSLALGGGEVPLLDLTAAYGAFGQGGVWRRPLAYTRVLDGGGRTLLAAEPESRQALSPEVAYLLTDILADDDARALGFGYHSALELDRPAAVKTGTTSDFRDNWTIGYTPQLVVGVWTGNADGHPMRDVSGVSGAAPIWREVMERALAGRPAQSFTRPDGLTFVTVCPPTGLLPGPDCPHPAGEWFVAGSEPAATEQYYRALQLCPATGLLYSNACSAPPVRRVFPFPSPELVPWMRAAGIELPPLPPYADVPVPPGASLPSDKSPADAARAVILSPDGGSTYHISSELPRAQQALIFEVAAVPGVASVRLSVDGTVVATLQEPPYRTAWQLEPGTHRFTAEALAADGSVLARNEVTVAVVQ